FRTGVLIGLGSEPTDRVSQCLGTGHATTYRQDSRHQRADRIVQHRVCGSIQADTGSRHPDHGPVAIPIAVRIKINTIAASPQASTLTNTPFLEMKSFMATLRDLPPGEYQITPEVKSASEKGWIGNRTLTVWESVRGERKN
ncbi:MAG TPA: hypothetical protein VGK59_15050, partial [Ohtaekwangia sp.]